MNLCLVGKHWSVPPGFRSLFLRLLRPKMPDFAGAFGKNFDKSCNVFCMFVAIKLWEMEKVAKKVKIFVFCIVF